MKRYWLAVVAYFRQWFHGIEIVEVYPYLYQSSKIRWPWDIWKLKKKGIQRILDLQGGFDISMPWLERYFYFPFKDAPVLPDADGLLDVAFLGEQWIEQKKKVLCHCARGYNRSGLVNCLILWLAGLSGEEALSIIRKKRPGSVTNPVFEDLVLSLKEDTPQYLRRTGNGRDN